MPGVGGVETCVWRRFRFCVRVLVCVCVFVRFGVFVVFVGVSVVVCDRGVYGFGGVDNSVLIVGVNGGGGEGEQAADVLQGRGARRGSRVFWPQARQGAWRVGGGRGGG